MAYHILIIENDKVIHEQLMNTLGNQYEIHHAANWENAQVILHRKKINLIVSEICPIQNTGFELCQAIKSNVQYCHIPFMLLSSRHTHAAFIRSLRVGADAYLQKPWTSEVIQLHIANLIKNRLRINAHFADAPFKDVRVMASSQTDETFLRKLEDYIVKNMTNANLDIDIIAGYMNMSRATFYRKIKALSSLTPKDLIDITRLKKATKLIASNEFSLFEIARIVGFNSQSSFHRNFQKHLKTTPMEYLGNLAQKKSTRAKHFFATLQNPD